MGNWDDVKAGIWRHYKGTHYQVFGVGHDANADQLQRFSGKGWPSPSTEHLVERIVVVYIPLELAAGHIGPAIAVRSVDDKFLDSWRDVVCGTKGCRDYGKQLTSASKEKIQYGAIDGLDLTKIYTDQPLAFVHAKGHKVVQRFTYLGTERTEEMLPS